MRTYKVAGVVRARARLIGVHVGAQVVLSTKVEPSQTQESRDNGLLVQAVVRWKTSPAPTRDQAAVDEVEAVASEAAARVPR